MNREVRRKINELKKKLKKGADGKTLRSEILRINKEILRKIPMEKRRILVNWLRGKKYWNEWVKKCEDLSLLDFSNIYFLDINKVEIIPKIRGKMIIYIDNEIDFSGFVFPCRVNFTNCIFSSSTEFINCRFSSIADFSRSEFCGDVSFSCAIFYDNIACWESVFREKVDFYKVVFVGEALFWDTRFQDQAGFRVATFKKDVGFGYVQFFDSATFMNCKFYGSAYFWEASFKKNANFSGSEFKNYSDFSGSIFSQGCDFENSIFGGKSSFKLCKFKGAVNFQNSIFRKYADFSAIQSSESFNLRQVKFFKVPNFSESDFHVAPVLDEIEIKDPLRKRGGIFSFRSLPDVSPDKARRVARRFRALGKMAHEARDWLNEMEFFAQETRVRRFGLDFPLGKSLLSLFRGLEWLRNQWIKLQLRYAPEHVRHVVILSPLSRKQLFSDKVFGPHVGRFWFGVIYEALSNFGRSFARPLVSWAILTIFFSMVYGMLAKPEGGWSWLDSLYLSIRHGLVVGGLVRTGHMQDVLLLMYGELHSGLALLMMSQTVISGFLLFLFFLAVRNHFRIR